MYYLIKSTLFPCSLEDCHKDKTPYVAIMQPQEWQQHKSVFDMGIDLEPELTEVHNTKAEENYDSVTGTFSIPRRADIDAEEIKFAFALDERGIVFIDNSGFAEQIVQRIAATRKWRFPSLERFLYVFLVQIIRGDQRLLDRYERELVDIEAAILRGDETFEMARLHEIRGDISDLRNHYEQLMDLGQALEENENGFFKEENVRYFRLFINKIARLLDASAALRDYTVQLRDLYQSQMDVKQNRIMTVLTIVTTIFLPLSLIAGWYGMNFKYMPELDKPLAYPIIIAISIVIVVASLLFLKKKKLL